MTVYVSVTVGRNRRPGSDVAPHTPLPYPDWNSFRMSANLALQALDHGWMEVLEGRATWHGVQEERYQVAVLLDFLPKQNLVDLKEKLRLLATKFDQDSIALVIGESTEMERNV